MSTITIFSRFIFGALDWTYRVLLPEERLLEQLCSNTKPSVKGIRWDRFLRLVEGNRLEIVVGRFLKNRITLPAPILAKLRKSQAEIQLISDYKNREFEIVLSALAKLDIKFVLMKTVAYTKTLFTVPIKAPYDIDLLLPYHQFQKASNVLTKLGYKPYCTHHEVDRSGFQTEDYYLPREEEIFKRNGVTIELHTTGVKTYGFPRRISSSARQCFTIKISHLTKIVSYGNIRVRVFTPTGLVLTLFVHIHQQCCQSLVGYFEFARVLTKYRSSIDWLTIIEIVDRHSIGNYFFWFLLLLNDFFRTPLPPIVQRKIDAFRSSLTPIQVVTYFIMKHRALFPITKPYTNWQRLLYLAIIDSHTIRSLFSLIYWQIAKITAQ